VTDATSPRIRPGTRTEIGRVNAVTTRALGAATGGRPPNLFTTVAKHRRLYRAWLRFAAALMPGGDLPRAESELVILRVAHNHDCIYEWRHHEHLAQRAGLSAAEVERVRSGPDAPGWSPRQSALLAATDELHDERVLGESTWQRLSQHLSETEQIELLMLVGHYAMLAMLLNSLRVEPDPPPSEPRGLAGRIAKKVADRR
jgi:AhpD family alkylhydroperoxidase